MEKKSIYLKSIDIKDHGIIEGYASVFNVVDHHNEIIAPGAFHKSIEIGKECNHMPKMLWQHDMKNPIGVWSSIYEDEKGLYVKGRILLKTNQGREAYDLIKSGAIEGLSIGFDVKKSQMCNKTGINKIIEVVLHEVSLVTIAANPLAKITKKLFEGNSISTNILNGVSMKNTSIAKVFNNDSMMSANVINESEKNFKNFIKTGDRCNEFIKKSLNSGDNSFLIPKEIVEKKESLKNVFSFRSICGHTTISTDSLDLLVDGDSNTDVGWMQETDSPKETNVDTLKKIHIPVHQIYSKPRATQKLLDDSSINIEKWLMSKIKEQMTVTENQAFLMGDGIGKPKGILKNDRTKSGAVTSGKIETFKSGKDGVIEKAEILMDVFHSLDGKYLNNAVWVMSRSALSQIRSLKDSNGQFIFQNAFSSEKYNSGTLLGHEVYIVDEMPKAISGKASTPVIFGNFKEAYHIAERSDVSVLRDPYSAKPYVEFYVTKRIGGDVINTNAIKCLDFSK